MKEKITQSNGRVINYISVKKELKGRKNEAERRVPNSSSSNDYG